VVAICQVINHPAFQYAPNVRCRHSDINIGTAAIWLAEGIDLPYGIMDYQAMPVPLLFFPDGYGFQSATILNDH